MKTALAVVGFDRPHYFEKCVESLSKNDFTGVDRFAFIDGGSRSRLSDYVRLIRTLGGFEICQRPIKFGCGKNIIGLRRYLFEELEYDNVIVLEDDVVVSDNYIQFLLRLAQFGKTQPGIGVVSAFSPIHTTPSDAESAASDVFLGDTNWISYLMYKETWDKIGPGLSEYESRFLTRDYHDRPHAAIRKWVELELRDAPDRNVVGRPDFVNRFWTKQTQKFYEMTGATGQDGTTCALLVRHGLAKLATRLNRCIHIGVHGQHSRPHHKGTQSLTSQPFHNLASDSSRSTFEWWEHP